jgi:DNA-binding response OmpR family regulator
LQTNSIRLKVSENEVVSFFNQVTEDFRFVAEKNGLSYEKEANLSERKYWFDPEKLEKIIINLLTNAFKFTEPGGSVSIRLFAEAHQFSITIEDSGKGFAPDKRNKVFERYYKVERANRNFFSQGAGIGLSLIEEFVKLHKGQIDLYSEPGYGTRFKISIPGNKNAYTPDERAQSGNWTAGRESGNIARFYQSPKLSQPLPFPTASRHRILLVEDNREMLEMLAVKLHRHFEVLQAQNGREGLAIISQSPPELVVTDLLMPEMNGIELAKAVKSDFQTCHIPVIMLTAKAALENKVEGYETGADAYMTKPFDFEVLIARINNLLEQRKRLRQKFVDDLHMESRSVAIEKKDQEFIDSVISTVIDHLDNNQFTLQELYRELGYSKTVFYNKIKALTDLNPSQFVRMIKLKEAAKLLKATDLNISEIAYNIGYSDVNYFRIQFKKQFKTTPKAFRDEHLGVGF